MEIVYYEKIDYSEELLKMFIDGYNFHYENRKDKFVKRDYENLKKEFLKTIESDSCLLCIEKNKIIGYLFFQFKGLYVKSLWINEIYILLEYRNNGYAKALIEKTEEIAKLNQCYNVELCCWSFNTNAQKIYEHLGFSEQRKIFERKV